MMPEVSTVIKPQRPVWPVWYVLYTFSRAEKAVERRLSQMGAEVFLPLYKEKRKWSDRMKIVEVPLFRSYIFVHCTRSELARYAGAEGVAGPVYWCGAPAAVKDDEIAEVHKFLTLVEQNSIISEGDVVRILGGPFEKRYGKVTRLDNRFVYLALESAGDLTVCVELRISKDFVKTSRKRARNT